MLSNKAYRFNYCILKQVLEELELLNNQSEDKQPQSNTDANDNAGDELTTPCNHVE